MLAEQRSKEGTVGAWEVVVPPPPPLPPAGGEIPTEGEGLEAEVDVKPPPDVAAAPYVDEDDSRSFRVRHKAAPLIRGRGGLGTLYDPGEIIVKKKKVEEPEIPLVAATASVPEAEVVKTSTPGEAKGGGWRTLDEEVNPTVVLPRQQQPPEGMDPSSQAPEDDPVPDVQEGGVQQEERGESKGAVREALNDGEAGLETGSGGSLFKRKVKRPVTSASSRRGGGRF